MVWDQIPGVTDRIRFRQQGVKALNKVPAVVIIAEYFVPHDATNNDMMNEIKNVEGEVVLAC
jgi:hypothetical protein